MSKSDMLNIDYGDNIDKSHVDLTVKSKEKVEHILQKVKWKTKNR